MLTNKSSNSSFHIVLLVGLLGVGIGILGGFIIGFQPILLGMLMLGIGVIAFFFFRFEQAVIGLLVLRSSLDIFSELQIPAAFAIGLDFLALIYVTVLLLTGKKVETDGFWWFFVGWLLLQGLWVILLPFGGLGLDGSFLIDSLREWVRLFSWVMVYLLVMQLKDKIRPEKIISWLLLGLIPPLTLALMQMLIPGMLPPILSSNPETMGVMVLEAESRIRGTLGHPNTFATYILLFIGVTCWNLNRSTKRWFWLILLSILAFFYVSTKALFSLMMIGIFVLVLIAPRLNILNIIGGILLFGLVIGLFASTEFGQERLSSLVNTPLLNPDIDISRAIMLSQVDHNSFNWRVAQWSYLLQQWLYYPIFGYGLGVSVYVSTNQLLPHNDYVRILVEQGIVGLLTYITFFAVQAVRLIKLIRLTPSGSSQNYLCQILLAILASIPVGMLTENIWSHTTFFLFWWTLFAVAGWDWDKQETTESISCDETRLCPSTEPR